MTQVAEVNECQELLDFVAPDLYRKNLFSPHSLSLGDHCPSANTFKLIDLLAR